MVVPFLPHIKSIYYTNLGATVKLAKLSVLFSAFKLISFEILHYCAVETNARIYKPNESSDTDGREVWIFLLKEGPMGH